jgi:hypothetical protein
MVSALQLLPCLRCSLDWFSFTFSLSFYTICFSPLPLKPCGCSTCLIMMQNVRPHPTSTPLHGTFYVKIWPSSVFGLSFCRLLGVGLQQPISKWIPNGCVTRVVLTQPLHNKFYIPFLLKVVVARVGSTTTIIKMNTKWNGYRFKLTLYQLTFESFDSFLRWTDKSSISIRLNDSRLF